MISCGFEGCGGDGFDFEIYTLRDFDYKNKKNSINVKWSDETTKLKVELVSRKLIKSSGFFGRIKEIEKKDRKVIEIDFKEVENFSSVAEWDEVISDVYHLAVNMIERKEDLSQVAKVLNYIDMNVENIQERLDKCLKENKLDMVESLYFFIPRIKGDLKVIFEPYLVKLIDKYLKEENIDKALYLAKRACKECDTAVGFDKIFEKCRDEDVFRKVFEGLEGKDQIKIIEHYVKKDESRIVQELILKGGFNINKNKKLLYKIAKKYWEQGNNSSVDFLMRKLQIEPSSKVFIKYLFSNVEIKRVKDF
jgi:hypothetical protein